MLPEAGIIFDAGTGMFRARDLLQTDTLDIFLSHLHLDHSMGLTFLYDVLWEKEISRVTVHIAEEKIPAIKQCLFNEALFPVQPNFDCRPLAETIELTDGLTMTSFPVDHPGGCHGFRLEGNGISFAYVTDTTASLDANYLTQIQGVRTLLHECNFPDGWEDRAELTGHSCITPVAQVAAAAKVERLFLTHLNPLNESADPLNLDSVRDIFGNIEIATDQLVIDLLD